jgi:hypothetical protein
MIYSCHYPREQHDLNSFFLFFRSAAQEYAIFLL